MHGRATGEWGNDYTKERRAIALQPSNKCHELQIKPKSPGSGAMPSPGPRYSGIPDLKEEVAY
jgi:hypothetical protein